MLEKSQLLSTWIRYVIVSFAPAGSVESLQSNAGVLSLVLALSAGETRFGVDGATFATATLILSVFAPVSSSVTVALTSALPAPASSDQLQSKLPVLLGPSNTSFDEVPCTPHDTELPPAGYVSAPGSVQLYV